MTTPTTVQAQIQLRADTAANWTAQNPTLLAAELGLETDTNRIKIGNGSTAWNSLAYFPFVVSGGTVLGNLEIGTTGTLTFEGSTADGFETTLAVANPTADRTITLPNQSGTVVVSGNATIVDADIAANAEIAVSKLADGAARQLLQTDAAGTGVEWTSNVDVPGTLDVTGAATFDAAVTIAGDLTVNGTTTNINTQNLVVEDKNIILADVTTPTDTTADGGGITLKGATDKTITWSDTTDSWEFNQPTITTGSSTAASFIPTGSTVPTNGVYLSGTNTVAVATNSTGRLFVDANGLCDVQSASSSVTRIGGGSSFIVRRAETSYASPSAISASVSVGGIAARGYGGTDYRAVGNLLFSTDGAVSDVSSPGYAAISTTPSGSVTPQERLRVTSDGKLGVGTSSPATLLHLSSATGTATPTPTELRIATTSNGSDWSTTAPWGRISFYSSDASNSGPKTHATIDAIAQGAAGGHSALRFAIADLTTTLYEGMRFECTGSTGQTFTTFSTSGSERARIDSSGRLGIGTTSPQQLLHLEAGEAFRLRLQRTGASPSTCEIVNGNNLLRLSQNVDGIAFETGTTPTERARLDSSGRLLVGTSGALTNYQWFGTTYIAPSLQVANENVGQASLGLFCNNAVNTSASQLMLAKAASGTAGLVDSGETLGVVVFNGADGTNLIRAASIEAAVDGTPGANDMPGRIVFSTTADGASSPTERVRITSGGLVQIGAKTNTDSAVLLVDQDAGANVGIGTTTTSTGTRYHLMFRNGNGQVGSISTNGSATAYNTSSDYRLKENVVPLTGAADRLNQLQVHRFNFIADPDTTVDGFIAHEAQAVVPECVTGTKDEVDADGNPVYQGIDQSKLVPLLTAALQEALAEIESLKARVTALEP